MKWVQTRREDFLASNYCRDHRIAVDVAADADGRLLGLRARIVMNAGAYSILPGFGSMLEATGAARQILGPYRSPPTRTRRAASSPTRSPAAPTAGWPW